MYGTLRERLLASADPLTDNGAMKCVVVSHTHWDREWYKTFQSFRARLVDTIDRVLDRIDEDEGFQFLLDGQTIVLEDYLEIRPDRRADLDRACRAGRIAIGPWYVQPDSLLPSGETHVRNLLEGRRVGSGFGPVSRIAYTPDSFGHPAQFPQLFCGFGLEPFVYWRGNGNEIDELPAEYLWEAPDGSAILAHHLSEGYFNAAGLPSDPAGAARWLEQVALKLATRSAHGCVLLMNGIDHALPDTHTGAVCAALAERSGWNVRRGLLEDFAAELSRDAPRFRGELLGGREAHLLPGVWSTRMPLKLRNRRVETLLQAWAEPWAAIGRFVGAPDEQPALRCAWRSLLQNQAHDSICGCSQDRVHEQMQTRYDAAEELGSETIRRILERLAGLGTERRTPWTDEIDIAVFNPSPHRRTDVVRFRLDPSSWFEFRGQTEREWAVHPLLRAALTSPGFTVHDQPARLIRDGGTDRVRLLPEEEAKTLEFVASDVPAFGWRRFRLRPSEAHREEEDDGTEIASGRCSVTADADGTLTVCFGDRVYTGLTALEDLGDRGDTYDFDPVDEDRCRLERAEVRRHRHASGIQHLHIRRMLSIPAALHVDRRRRSHATVLLPVETRVRLAPEIERVDVRVRVDNTACDHRLRLLFPTGAPVTDFLAASTFDLAGRSTKAPDDRAWKHPAPATFPHQGLVSANGLTIAAPGLPECEVTPSGVIALTLLRAVGWLSRMDLYTRPEPAGPVLPTPGAQCLGRIEADLSLFPALDLRSARDAETGLWAVASADAFLLAPDQPLLEIDPPDVLLSAFKPAEAESGAVLRLLNPTDQLVHAKVRLGFSVRSIQSIRLDETPCEEESSLNGRELSISVPPHALRSVLLR